MSESTCLFFCKIIPPLVADVLFFSPPLSLFNVKAFPKSTGSNVGHTRVECVTYCPTLHDSSVTTGNYTLHRAKTVMPGRGKDLTIVS